MYGLIDIQGSQGVLRWLRGVGPQNSFPFLLSFPSLSLQNEKALYRYRSTIFFTLVLTFENGRGLYIADFMHTDSSFDLKDGLNIS